MTSEFLFMTCIVLFFSNYMNGPNSLFIALGTVGCSVLLLTLGFSKELIFLEQNSGIIILLETIGLIYVGLTLIYLFIRKIGIIINFNFILLIIVASTAVMILIFSDDTKRISLSIRGELNIKEKQILALYRLRILTCTAIVTTLGKLVDNKSIRTIVFTFFAKFFQSNDVIMKYLLKSVFSLIIIIGILSLSYFAPKIYKKIFLKLIVKNIFAQK